MSGDNQRQSDTTASGAFSQADYAVHGAAYEILRRTLSLSVEARNARMDAWRELEEAHREAQAARDDAYRQVAELQEKINRALEQERSLLEQALEEARRLAEEAQSLRNAAQQEVAHAQEQRREAEIMRQEALRLLTQASFGDPGGSAGGEPPIEEPAEKPLEKPAESPLAGDRNEPEEEPNSLQSSLSPENGAGPQSSPEDLSSAYNVSYKGQFAIVVKPLPPADTLGRVWAALEQVVGIGRIIGSLPLEDGSGLEFTLDMGKDRVSVAELVSTIPEATAEPVSQDTLVINLAEGQ